MLHQISWTAFGLTLVLLAVVYYGYVGLRFYREELQMFILRFSGRQHVPNNLNGLHLPEHSITGATRPDDIDFVAPEELSFGPADHTDEEEGPFPEEKLNPSAQTRLLGDFSEMISETKTLIRVINESNESKENFEMLFRLVIQKYSALAGTDFEQQVNTYLLNEGAPQFPFSLNMTDLESYWNTTENLQNV